jgi:hypothetical protein
LASRSRFKWWPGAVLGLLVLVVSVHTAWWVVSEQQLRAGLKVWMAERRATGWTIVTQKPRPARWPLAAGVSVADCTMSGGDTMIPGGVRWHANRFVVSLPLFRPHTLVLHPEGEQRLGIGRGSEIAYAAEQAEAAIPLPANGMPGDADVTASKVVARSLGSRGEMSIALFRGHLAWNPQAVPGAPAITLAASAEAIGLPVSVRWPLGSHISSVSLSAALDGWLPDGAGPAQRAAAWRRKGGQLEVERLALGWGPLGLSVAGTLKLDANLQLIGSGNAHIVDYAATLDRLAANGAISPHTAVAVKAVVSLLSPQQSGEPIDVPVVLEDHRLSIQSIPLARLPTLDWSGS